MATDAAVVTYEDSFVWEERVEVSRLYKSGFLYLKDDPESWIQRSPIGRLLSVRSFELNLWDYKGERIGDSIGKLSQLTHLVVTGGLYLECLPNAISKLHNLQQLKVHECSKLQILPENLGFLDNLSSLTLYGCSSLKSLPDSVANLSKLRSISISKCDELEELPLNLGKLESLTYLSLDACYSLRFLPWSITKLSKLRFLYLPRYFRLETLPSRLNGSVIISVEGMHIRKTWGELKTEMELFLVPIIPVTMSMQATHFRSTPGYLRFKGDPAPIWSNSGLQSLVRILDLDLGHHENIGEIPNSIGELPEVTHLYISHGFLRHLPLSFTRITHMSLFGCAFECDTEDRYDNLRRLSTLVSLHLESCHTGELPEHMDLPVNLRHLSLHSLETPSMSFMTSMSKLPNLKTLDLYGFCDLQLLPLNMNLTKLILRDSSFKSLPLGLRHLEIIHEQRHCQKESCSNVKVCVNQLVNLKTLSYTCYRIEFLPSTRSLQNLQKLQLKDCFNLKELPPSLDESVQLCTLNVSGTRIKTLPNSIMKLHNLKHLVLPKCFVLESLPPEVRDKVRICIDETDNKYYRYEGYYDYNSDEGSETTMGSTEEVDGVFFEESRLDISKEQESPQRTLDHLPDANQIIEGSHFIGRADPISNTNHQALYSSENHKMENFHTGNKAWIIPFTDVNFLNFPGNTRQVHVPTEIEDSRFVGGINAVGEKSSHAFSSIHNQDVEIEALPSRNGDCVVTSAHEIPAESISNLDANFLGMNNQEASQIGQMDIINLESEDEIASCDSLNSIHGLQNVHDKNPRNVDVKKKTQKREILVENTIPLMSQNMTMVDAAEQLGVSMWPSSKKRKLQDANKNKTHNTRSSSKRNLSQLNMVYLSNPADHGSLQNLNGPNQLTMSSDHVTSKLNVVNDSTSVIRAIKESPMSTQCHMVDNQCAPNQRAKKHVNGAKKCASSNTIQPNGSCSSSFVVKATYIKRTVRFDFSLNFSIEQLREEVGKRLELEVGKFKINYQDEDKEWMLMTRMSDLEHAVRLSKSSGSNVVRLSIKLKK